MFMRVLLFTLSVAWQVSLRYKGGTVWVVNSLRGKMGRHFQASLSGFSLIRQLFQKQASHVAKFRPEHIMDKVITHCFGNFLTILCC